MWSLGLIPVIKRAAIFLKRGEEQNREEGEMAQKELGGGRNMGKK